jgi:hypothetical protein
MSESAMITGQSVLTNGLNLEPTDGTSEFILIDHIEKPARDYALRTTSDTHSALPLR